MTFTSFEKCTLYYTYFKNYCLFCGRTIKCANDFLIIGWARNSYSYEQTLANTHFFAESIVTSNLLYCDVSSPVFCSTKTITSSIRHCYLKKRRSRIEIIDKNWTCDAKSFYSWPVLEGPFQLLIKEGWIQINRSCASGLIFGMDRWRILCNI